MTWNPHAPTVHMNTRFVVTTKPVVRRRRGPDAGADRRRNQDDADAIAFHAAMQGACERFAPSPTMSASSAGATSISS
jgi:coproporphyrinogen III oxidase